MILDDTFEVNFSADLLREVPAGKRMHYFPAETREGVSDGLVVSVSPYVGESWVGVFAFGQRDAGDLSEYIDLAIGKP